MAEKLVKAEAKMVRISPRKADRILKLIRGKNAATGLTILQFLPHSAARYIEKVLKSAIANAEHNDKLAKDSLVIAQAVANSGTLLKRWRAGGKGRAQRIKKYTSHIRIAVQEGSR
jgi:large subunit ribosomal protein L22